MKTTSHIQSKRAISRLLDIKHPKHNEYCYKTAIEYLVRRHGKDSYQMKVYEYSPTWWSWWRNQWNIKCTQVLEILGFEPDTRAKLNEVQKDALIECIGEVHGGLFDNFPSQKARERMRAEGSKKVKEVNYVVWRS